MKRIVLFISIFLGVIALISVQSPNTAANAQTADYCDVRLTQEPNEVNDYTMEIEISNCADDVQINSDGTLSKGVEDIFIVIENAADGDRTSLPVGTNFAAPANASGERVAALYYVETLPGDGYSISIRPQSVDIGGSEEQTVVLFAGENDVDENEGAEESNSSETDTTTKGLEGNDCRNFNNIFNGGRCEGDLFCGIDNKCYADTYCAAPFFALTDYSEKAQEITSITINGSTLNTYDICLDTGGLNSTIEDNNRPTLALFLTSLDGTAIESDNIVIENNYIYSVNTSPPDFDRKGNLGELCRYSTDVSNTSFGGQCNKPLICVNRGGGRCIEKCEKDGEVNLFHALSGGGITNNSTVELEDGSIVSGDDIFRTCIPDDKDSIEDIRKANGIFEGLEQTFNQLFEETGVLENPPNGITECTKQGVSVDNIAACENCYNSGGIFLAIGCVDPTPLGIMTRLIQIALGIMGGVALIQLIVAGIQYQSGNEEKIEEAKSRIFTTIGGIAILVFSVLLLRIIGVDIFDVLPEGAI